MSQDNRWLKDQLRNFCSVFEVPKIVFFVVSEQVIHTTCSHNRLRGPNVRNTRCVPSAVWPVLLGTTILGPHLENVYLIWDPSCVVPVLRDSIYRNVGLFARSATRGLGRLTYLPIVPKDPFSSLFIDFLRKYHENGSTLLGQVNRKHTHNPFSDIQPYSINY